MREDKRQEPKIFTIQDLDELRKESLIEKKLSPYLSSRIAQLVFGADNERCQRPEVREFRPKLDYSTELPSHKQAEQAEPEQRKPNSYGTEDINQEGTYYHGLPEEDILLLDVFGLVPKPKYGSNVAFSWSNDSGYKGTTVYKNYGAAEDNEEFRKVTAVISKDAGLSGKLMTDALDSRIPIGDNGEFCREAGLSVEQIKTNPELASIQPDTWLRTEDYVHPKHILGWIVSDEKQAQRIKEMMDLEILTQRRIWFPNGRLYRDKAEQHSGGLSSAMLNFLLYPQGYKLHDGARK